MRIQQIHLKQFRCFDTLTLNITAPVVLVKGLNGTGKTSLLEAIHYACYLRSFRSSTPRDLLQFGHDAFFVKLLVQSNQEVIEEQHEIQVGFSHKKRSVKVNQKAIGSYKELMNYCRVVTLTEDDLELIKGGPDVRRAFIDQAVLLANPDSIQRIRAYKKIVVNRNALLTAHRFDKASYDIWTQQLWEASRTIQQQRCDLLTVFEARVNELLSSTFDDELMVTLEYQPKRSSMTDNFEAFMAEQGSLCDQERRFKRSLFGAHLDDFVVSFQGRASRTYASRGQQKLIVLLLKIAQLFQLKQTQGPAFFLLDDFMTDFDLLKIEALLPMLTSLSTQLIFTSPDKEGLFERRLAQLGAQEVFLEGVTAAEKAPRADCTI